MPARATAPRQYPKRQERLVAAPLVGMDDTLDWQVSRPGLARELTNCYVPPGALGRRVVGRPGLAALGAQLGGVGARTAQFLGQFVKSDNTRQTIAIVGGKFYTLNWSTRTWTETLSAANLAGASVTLSTTARVRSVTLNDKIVFWDGTNTPWMWDGTAGGGITELTGAPTFTSFGAVYYAKVFGAAADTFYWSEEGDPTTGYGSGGYANAWAPFNVTKITSLAASNSALYVAESNRMMRITGAVATDFQTSGTRSDVSERIGTQSPMLVTDQGIVLVSSDGAPFLFNGQMVDLWRSCQALMATVNRDALGAVQVLEWPTIDAVLIGLPLNPNDVVSQWGAFRLSDGEPRYIGRWNLGLNDTAAVVLNDDDEFCFLVTGSGDGYVYEMGQPTGSTWNDAFAGGTASIPHTVTWQPLTGDPDLERHYDRGTVILDGTSTATQITYRYQTTRKTSTPITKVIPGGAGDLLDISFILDTSTLATDEVERRVVFGINGDGRGFAPTVGHDEMGKTFSVKTTTVEAYPWGTDSTHP